MKKLIPFFLLAAGFFACDGPDGVQDEKAIDGPQGVSVESFVFEYNNLDFKTPDYSLSLPFPDSYKGTEGDVPLVFLLWDVAEGGENTWRALPQSLMTENGTIQYNYNFTSGDAKLSVTTDFDKTMLESADTDDWLARVVVVPGKYLNPNGKLENVDLSDYDAVMNALGVADKPVQESYNDIKRR